MGDHFFKIIATGVNIPEKTQFLHRFALNSTDFADSLHVFFNFSSIKLPGNNNCFLQIYDFSRYFVENFAPLEYCKKINGALIFFDCKDENSIETIENSINFLQYIEKNTPVHLIGLNYNRDSIITPEIINEFLNEDKPLEQIFDFDFSFVKNSTALSNIGIYRNLCQKIMEQHKFEATQNLFKEISTESFYHYRSRNYLVNCFNNTYSRTINSSSLYKPDPEPLPFESRSDSTKI